MPRKEKCSILTLAMSEDFSQLVHLSDSGSVDASRASTRDRQLLGLDREALAARMVEAGEPAWRGKQLEEALYHQWIT